MTLDQAENLLFQGQYGETRAQHNYCCSHTLHIAFPLALSAQVCASFLLPAVPDSSADCGYLQYFYIAASRIFSAGPIVLFCSLNKRASPHCIWIMNIFIIHQLIFNQFEKLLEYALGPVAQLVRAGDSSVWCVHAERREMNGMNSGKP